MALTKRQGKILEILKDEKKGYVSKLSTLFNMTEASIRLDLADLEDAGYIRRFHGGAKIIESSSYEIRIKHNKKIKMKIACKAFERIHPGETIFLDSGTTVLMLAKLLTELENITIVTNSIPIVSSLGGEIDKNILLIGGEYDHSEQCCVGLITENYLENIYVSKTFMGCDSIDIENGILSSNLSRFGYINKVINNSKQTILLVDSSKFKHVGGIKIADATAVDLIITDRNLPENIIEKLHKKDIKVELVD